MTPWWSIWPRTCRPADLLRGPRWPATFQMQGYEPGGAWPNARPSKHPAGDRTNPLAAGGCAGGASLRLDTFIVAMAVVVAAALALGLLQMGRKQRCGAVHER